MSSLIAFRYEQRIRFCYSSFCCYSPSHSFVLLLQLHQIPIFHISNCTGNSTFELNSTNHTNLKTLLSWFSSNATNSAGSHIAKVVSSGNSSVYGLFQCNADIMPEKCQKCIDQAVYNVTSECTTSKEAVVFVKFYFLRYSYKDFLTIA
ncbi:hypothetical protein HN51_011662 [Arachis hypogaea]